ncbi:MAG: hypothetical protein ABI878_03805 [Acidobacteriota bacterium]
MDGAKPEEIEEFTGDERALSDLLHGLNRVDAPANFDTRVKARIADGDTAKRSGWGLPVPVYAISLAVLLVFLGAVFLLGESIWGTSKSVPAVAQIDHSKPAADRAGIGPGGNQQPVGVNTDGQVPGSNGEVAGANTAQQPLFDKRNPAGRLQQPGGGSVESAQNSAEQLVPRGFDQNAMRQIPRTGGPSLPVSIFLDALGVKAAFDGEQLKVSSVRGESVGDRSGVKAGDIIAAIGDTKINPSTTFTGSIKAQSMTVIRGGKSIKLRLSVS